MKKILFVISSDLYVRNYIQTGVIESLSKKYDCKIIVSKNIFNKDEVEHLDSFAGYYIYDPIEEKKRFYLMNVILWRYRKKSTTFMYRFMRISGLRNLNFFSSLKNFKEFLLFAKRNISRNSRLFIFIYGNKLLFPFFMFLYKTKLRINKSLKKLIESIGPDIILFPSSAFDPIGIDLIKIGTRNKIKTAFLIDNWDNLSSKTIFLKKPDFLTVWGKQSLEHAIDIHGFREEQVLLIGTPRFDIYYKTLNNLPKSPINGKYVLFTGAALEMDETGALKELDEEIEQNKEIYGDLKIIYRPHPWRQGTNDFEESLFKHIQIDSQMKDHYARLKHSEITNTRKDFVDFQPKIEYYPAIIGNALFIVSPLTTMALEALIMEKRVLLIVYNDRKNFTSPNNVFKYYEHFRGIERLNGFVFCKEKSRLKEFFRQTFVKMNSTAVKNVKSDLSYFLFNDEREYKQRLFDAIEHISNSNKN